MHRYILTLIYLFLVNGPLNAQEGNCDMDYINASWGRLYQSYTVENDMGKSLDVLHDLCDCARELEVYAELLYGWIYIANLEKETRNYDRMHIYLDSLGKHLDIHDDIIADDWVGIKVDYYFLLGEYYQHYKKWYELSSLNYQKSVDILCDYSGYNEKEDVGLFKEKNKFSFNIVSLFNNLAIAYDYLGDLEKSILYHKMSIQLVDVFKDDTQNYTKLGVLQNLFHAYVENKEWTLAEKTVDEFLEVNKNFKSVSKESEYRRKRMLGLSYKNRAIIKIENGDYTTAENLLSASLEVCEDPMVYTYSHQLLSEIFVRTNRLDSSRNALEKSDSSSIVKWGLLNREMAQNKIYWSRYHIGNNAPDKALEVLESGLEMLIGHTLDAAKNESKLDYANATDKMLAFDFVLEILNLAISNHQVEDIGAYMELGRKLIAQLHANVLTTDSSKFIFSKKCKAFYEKATLLSEEQDRNIAYLNTQKAKGYIMLQKMQDTRAAEIVGLPLEIQQNGKDFRQEILRLGKERDEYAKNQMKVDSIDKLLFSTNQQYDAYVQNLEKEYPTYHALKYQIPETSLNELKGILRRKGATLLEYFLGDDNMFIFVIDENGIQHVETVPVTDTLIADITTMNHCVSTLDFSYGTFVKFHDSSSRLYEHLIGHVDAHIHNKNLIVIPDEQLNLIPFEALVSRKKTFDDTSYARYHQLDYLIADYDISYHYSSNLIGIRAMNGNEERKDFLGIAPSFVQRGGIQELKNNLQEVESGLGRYPEGKTIVGLDATYDEVMSSIKEYRMVHFATHAIFNDRVPLDSRIELADTSIYIYEIFGMDHNLDLAIMSACETASGERKKGEGVISLSRAFIQSGCPSVIASLWSISDQKTSMLMQIFHEYMGAGKSPKHSLSEAKRRYIDEAITKNVHPFYWSGFIQIGEVEEPERKIPLFIWIGVGLLFISGLIFGILKWK